MSFASVAVAVIGTGVTAYSQYAAGQAAQAGASYQQDVLKRKRADARTAADINRERLRDDKRKQLARIRVQNASSGVAQSGTQMDVFGEIDSLYDEQIDEATTRALAGVSEYSSQIAGSEFSAGQAAQATNIALAGTAVSGLAQTGIAYGEGYDRTGEDPFNIFT